MRRTIRRKENYKITREMIFLGIILIIFTAIGTYLNRAFPSGEKAVLESINSINNYYSQGYDISVKAVVFSNLRQDILFLASIVIFSLFVFTFPLAIISFLLKGMSVGYTINSCILLMKYKSIKMILLMMIKNFIIIPGAILLILVSWYYIKNIYEEYKKGRKEGIIFLSKRFLLNSILIIVISVSAQLLLNAVYIGILQFLVR
ncbi:MAG: hypothetical protein RSG52_06080 [Terrisporobacter sp.]|uniref:hypothetical protein n=1 Tax=Terrisporobacter sp. TaxID=1965305 RepID=UPI002FC8B7F4